MRPWVLGWSTRSVLPAGGAPSGAGRSAPAPPPPPWHLSGGTERAAHPLGVCPQACVPRGRCDPPPSPSPELATRREWPPGGPGCPPLSDREAWPQAPQAAGTAPKVGALALRRCQLCFRCWRLCPPRASVSPSVPRAAEPACGSSLPAAGGVRSERGPCCLTFPGRADQGSAGPPGVSYHPPGTPHGRAVGLCSPSRGWAEPPPEAHVRTPAVRGRGAPGACEPGRGEGSAEHCAGER